jgi:hypothetical protein
MREDNSEKDENICKHPSTERNEDTENMEVERTGGDGNDTKTISVHKSSRRLTGNFPKKDEPMGWKHRRRDTIKSERRRFAFDPILGTRMHGDTSM